MKNTSTATATPKRPAVKKNATPKPSESGPPTAEPVHKREFNRIQEIVIDAVSDMVISGGHDDSIDALVTAALDHYTRRTYSKLLEDDPDRLEKIVNEERRKYWNEWRLDLLTAARANKRAPEAERQMPTDVSQKIRQAFRNQVESLLEDFLAQGAPEELFLMKEVLDIWDSRHRTPSAKDVGVPLAMGFQFAIGEDVELIKVPWRMRKKVQSYVDALWAVEGQDL